MGTEVQLLGIGKKKGPRTMEVVRVYSFPSNVEWVPFWRTLPRAVSREETGKLKKKSTRMEVVSVYAFTSHYFSDALVDKEKAQASPCFSYTL